ncbi:hypothetical protein VTN96DRAFT_7124 [Rasamsonia emersonii]
MNAVILPSSLRHQERSYRRCSYQFPYLQTNNQERHFENARRPRSLPRLRCRHPRREQDLQLLWKDLPCLNKRMNE